ncbi:hypothetical protein RhiirB3_451323, partial [Rhizophagus irregularis]
THLISWKAYYDNLVGRRDPGHIPYWYIDIQQSTTVPDSNNRLLDKFITIHTNDSSFYELEPCLSSPPTTKNWIVTLDDLGSPIFGKQLLIQASRGTCSIRNADLTLCTPTVSLQHSLILPTTNERIRSNTSEVTSPFTWADIEDAEAAAIYAVLTISPRDSEVIIYTDSQTAIDGLRSCSSFVYSNSRLYYKTTNFELWAIIERTILSKNLTVFFVKVKAHSGNYLNDFADSLANTAHTASSSILISGMDLASAHDFVLIYDNNVVCESNPQHLLKQYYQTQLMRDLLNLTRFHFTSLLSSNIDYVID